MSAIATHYPPVKHVTGDTGRLNEIAVSDSKYITKSKLYYMATANDIILTDRMSGDTNIDFQDLIGDKAIFQIKSSIIDDILSFKALGEDWNGYGASAPDKGAINKAVSIVEDIYIRSYPVKVLHAYPLADGGIQIDLESAENYYELEVYPETVNILKFDRDNEVLSEVEENLVNGIEICNYL